LWLELLDNKILKDKHINISMMNVHDVLNVVQHMLVLLGNANELISQANIFRAVDQGLEQ